jgi:hypothetical protein
MSEQQENQHRAPPQPPALSPNLNPHLQSSPQWPLPPIQFQNDGLRGSTWTPAPDPTRKRARPTVSCFECRRKKLKCDRLQPCSQCTRSRREDLCHYSAGPSRPPAPASDVGLSESAAKRARYDGPMTQIAVGNGRPEAAPVRNEDEASMPGQPLGRIHFKRDKSMYLGIGDRTAMLDHVKLQSNSCVKIVLTFIVRGCQTVYHALLRRSRNESFDEGADSLSKVVSTQAKESTDSFVPRCNSSIGNVEFFTHRWLIPQGV